MPDISFQTRLIEAVVTGSKPGTVRQVRLKNPIKAWDVLGLVTGARTKKYKRHARTRCEKVYNISLDLTNKKICIEGVELIPIIRHWFAVTDIQGPEKMFWDFFTKQKYDRPLVYICWDAETVAALDQWIETEARKIKSTNWPLHSQVWIGR